MAAPAGASDEHAVAAGEVDDTLDLVGRHRLLGASIAYELDPREEPLAPHVTHPRMLQQGTQAVEEIGAVLGGALDQPLLEDDLDVAIGDRRGDRMAAVRRDLDDMAVVGGLADEGLDHVVAAV